MGSTVVENPDSSHYSICTVDTESKYTTFGFLIMPFKLFYDLVFLSCVIVITILYFLIYRKIYLSRKIKRNRKREIFFSSLIKQAEGGIFPETLLLKAKFESNHENRFLWSFFCKNCCLYNISGIFSGI